VTELIFERLNPFLAKINGTPVLRSKARKATTCVYSRKPIKCGDWVYRPFSNSAIRSARWLAAEVEPKAE
jgi:hypothetical protein